MLKAKMDENKLSALHNPWINVIVGCSRICNYILHCLWRREIDVSWLSFGTVIGIGKCCKEYRYRSIMVGRGVPSKPRFLGKVL